MSYNVIKVNRKYTIQYICCVFNDVLPYHKCNILL